MKDFLKQYWADIGVLGRALLVSVLVLIVVAVLAS